MNDDSIPFLVFGFFFGFLAGSMPICFLLSLSDIVVTRLDTLKDKTLIFSVTFAYCPHTCWSCNHQLAYRLCPGIGSPGFGLWTSFFSRSSA